MSSERGNRTSKSLRDCPSPPLLYA